MTCSVTIQHVNFVTTTPTHRLRVTGLAPGCWEVTLTTTPAVIALPGPVTAMPDGSGRFRFDVPLTQSFTCNTANPPTVTVSCSGKYNTHDVCDPGVWTGVTVPCCEGAVTVVKGIVPLRSLTPTQLSVEGTCFGCASNMVTISADKILPAGGSLPLVTPSTVMVDPLTGGFTHAFPLIASGVTCADPIVVNAVCSSGACNIAPFRGASTARNVLAELAVAVAPCAQPTDPNTQVTITARIGLPKGAVRDFELDFGNGQPPCTFTIDNSMGDTDAVYQQQCTSLYSTHNPVPYKAILRIPILHECPPVDVDFDVNCEGCPGVTTAVTVGNCVIAGASIDPRTVGTRPVRFRVDVPTGVPANLKTTAIFTYGAPDQRPPIPTLTPPFPGFSYSHGTLPSRMGAGPIEEEVFLRPGSYLSNVTLTFQQGTQFFCPLQPPIDLSTRPAGQPPMVDVPGCIPYPRSRRFSSRRRRALRRPPALLLYRRTGRSRPMSTGRRFRRRTRPLCSTSGLSPGRRRRRTRKRESWPVRLRRRTPSQPRTDKAGRVRWRRARAESTSRQAVTMPSRSRRIIRLLPVCRSTRRRTRSRARRRARPSSRSQGRLLGTAQTLGGINSSPSPPPCADPMQSLTATVDFTATGTNLGSGPYNWDFGDPASGAANTLTTTTPTPARHVYSMSGSFPVKVTIPAQGNCPETEWMSGVTIPACPPATPTGPGGAEELAVSSSGGLRWGWSHSGSSRRCSSPASGCS